MRVKSRKTRNWIVAITLPIPGFAPLVGPAVGGLAGDGVQHAPGGSSLRIQLPFFLLGQLPVGNILFHMACSFRGFSGNPGFRIVSNNQIRVK